MPIDTAERTWNANISDELRKNAGVVTSGPLAGADLLLLASVGAKSRERRVSPLGYSRDGERYVVVGSNSGRDWNPAWVRNITANPNVTIEVGGESFPAVASIQTGAERRRLLDAHIAKIPIFARYETMTDRPLPVVTLEPAKAETSAEATANDWEEALIADLRANGGRPSEGPLAGHPLLLMTSTGARTGQTRRAILTWSRDGNDYIVAGTKGGAPTDPAWVANIRANGGVTLEVAGETFAALATLVEGRERDRLWAQHAAALPWFAEYPEKSGRVIPMVRLRRKG